MDHKAPAESLSTFKELRIKLNPTPAGSIVQIQLPSNSTFGRLSRVTRRVLSSYAETKSEEEYRRKHVASASDVFFRRENNYPRNILWRTLDNSTVLELRSVDLSKDEGESREAGVVLQIGFPSMLRQGNIGFADAEHGNALEIFALTKTNDLYTFSIHSSFFYYPAASEGDLDRWCQIYRPSSLSISQTHKLTSCSPRDLIFSLIDGRLLRLTRQPGSGGSSWTEVAYNDGQWGSSLRGLIRWQGSNTVRYEGSNLDQHTALATSVTPDGRHLVSVALNHTLKIWSLETGRPTLTKDLLDVEREPHKVVKFMLDPGMTHVLSLESSIRSAFAGDQYYLVTYTPHEGGNFKIWGVRDADFGVDGVRDLFPEDNLRVPDPDDGALWTLTDFKLKGYVGNNEVSFWVMLRLNRRYKLYHKRFSNLASLAQEWMEDWEQAAVADRDLPATELDFDIPSPEPLGIALDTQLDLLWMMSTQTISPVRKCTDTEILAFNSSKVLLHGSQNLVQSIESEGTPARSESATLIEAAARLRSDLTVLRLDKHLDDAIRAELWQDPSYPVPERMQAFYDHAQLGSIGDRQYDELLMSLNGIGGLDSLGTDSFFAILETFPDQISARSNLVSTSFGRRALVTGALEMTRLHQCIVTDLLLMIVFLDQEIDREEYAMASLETARVFEELTNQLRILQIMSWIGTNSRQKGGHTVSILEDLFAEDIRPQSSAHQSASAALTGSIRDLLRWIGGGNDASITVDQVAVNIQCNLLVNGDLALATAFLRYLPSTAWATYIRARHALLCHEYASAAVYFKKAAFSLSRPHPPSSFYTSASAGLLQPLEAAQLASGLDRYYAHLVTLFSAPTVSAHSQTIEFASLALQHLNATLGTSSQRQSELLSQLHNAALALGDYDAAFAALVRLTDRTLRKAALKSMVGNMLVAGAVANLLDLPFTVPMKAEVDALLASRARDEASSETARVAKPSAAKVLYAWRIRQGDYRGAASSLVESLQARKGPQGKKRQKFRTAGNKDGVLEDYLVSINALSLLSASDGVEDGENEGWVFVENGDGNGTRSLLRLRDLRKEYQEEMDMREKWDNGRFAFTAAEDDEDEDGDTSMMT